MGNNILTIQDVIDFVTSEKEIDVTKKINILRSKIIDKEVLKYVQKILENLYIEVEYDYEGFLFELMQIEKLTGWCWQTTESAIVFFNDDAYIERGNIKLDDEELSWEYHSWICFRFNDEEYVFDPCLNILCKKADYVEVYETDVKGKVSAKAMKEELIRQMLTPKKDKDNDSEIYKEFQSFIKSIVSSKTYKRIEDEVRVGYQEDINTPLYRNGAGYKGIINKGVIKKLTVHFYDQICY